MDSLCRARNIIIYVLSWRTVSVLTRVLFWCLFPSLLRNSANKHKLPSRERWNSSSHEYIHYSLFMGHIVTAKSLWWLLNADGLTPFGSRVSATFMLTCARAIMSRLSTIKKFLSKFIPNQIIIIFLCISLQQFTHFQYLKFTHPAQQIEQSTMLSSYCMIWNKIIILNLVANNYLSNVDLFSIEQNTSYSIDCIKILPCQI